jgi:ABC-type multidrug transport system fused ATPase/permease subunit
MEQMIRAQEDDSGGKKISRLHQGLQFSDVDFAYPGHKNKVLSHITLEFKANTVTAVVGPSGAGKSTLIDLIPRLRRASAGKVLFDGLDINDIELKSLRKQIAYVPQSPQIFSGTISNHIRYGNLDATDGEILQAARLAGAHDFIQKLSEKYYTDIGDGAYELSGGQRQRLDLARALVSQSSILIMDEPTSNLDAESEDAFKASLQKIKDEGRTTVVIVAHRLNNIAAADQIIVLVSGRIEAVGTHTDLITGDNWYANAYQSQITN